ncbi:FecR domain-containing protein [Pseudomonas sp. PDM13]|uniref:FecR domain-containing protein n=1 Tax=Pseudomonas sp. PDM13 TaxID=2769255 RepID=UPI0021E062D6|nr:FecR domain-containing protein [Pseudomonas sp. PDM13]MCU9949390.1 FecR domain-containing protein [Pseudomonas sp. PDM13]
MSALNPQVVEQAIAWRVRLASGTCPAEEFAACQHWRGIDPEHELAWQRLEALGGRFSTIPAALGHAALDGAQHDPQRRRALKALALLIAAGGAGVLGVQGPAAFQPWLASLRTGTGERRSVTLPDGGRLHLNAGSAVDIDYDADRRLLRLYQGEILVETAADPARRLFLVDTGPGVLRALGTRFLVRQRPDRVLLAVYAGAVEVQPREGATRLLGEGWQSQFDAHGMAEPQRAESDRASWVDGVLVARDMRLDEFVTEFDRQRHGVLRCDPAVAALRISGVFPLDDSERALAAVARTLPVQVIYRTRWWVTLAPATG